MSFDLSNPLARSGSESNRASVALGDYARLGPGRSLSKLHQKYTEQSVGTPPTRNFRVIQEWSRRYEWQDRVATYDKIQAEREQKAYEDQRLLWRKRRSEILQGYFAKIAQALQKLDPEQASMSEVTTAMRMVVQELRAEFDDEPTERTEVVSNTELSVKLVEDVRRKRWEQISEQLSDILNPDGL